MAEQKQAKPAEDKNFKHMVRVANTDLDGAKPISNALTKIKGVGFMLANTACGFADVDKSKRAGTLADDEIARLAEFLEDPQKGGAPVWMLNRRKDPETNEDKHLLGGDIKFVTDNDIKVLKKIKSYKGLRHAVGLTVRGQRTKSNFRRNKGKVTLGVKRKPGAKSGK